MLRQAGRLLAERPRTRAELGRLLAERWPDAEPRALGYAVTLHLALCQVPPRGVWGKGGPATWAPLADWLGAPLGPGRPTWWSTRWCCATWARSGRPASPTSRRGPG